MHDRRSWGNIKSGKVPAVHVEDQRNIRVPWRFRPESSVLSRKWPGHRMDILETAVDCGCLYLCVTDLMAQALLQQPFINETELMVMVVRMLEGLLDLARPKHIVVTFDGALSLQALCTTRRELHLHAVLLGADAIREAQLLAGTRWSCKLESEVVSWLTDNHAETIGITYIPSSVPGEGLMKMRSHGVNENHGKPFIYGRTNGHVLTAWIIGADLLYVSTKNGIYHMRRPVGTREHFMHFVRYDTQMLPLPLELCELDASGDLKYLQRVLDCQIPARPAEPSDVELELGRAVADLAKYYITGQNSAAAVYTRADAVEWFTLPDLRHEPQAPFTTFPPSVALALCIPNVPGLARLGVKPAAVERFAKEDTTGNMLPLQALLDDQWTSSMFTERSTDTPACAQLLLKPKIDSISTLDPSTADSAVLALATDGDIEHLL
jgi:hypothetical protein